MITKVVPARLPFADIRPDQPVHPDTQASRGRAAILPEPWSRPGDVLPLGRTPGPCAVHTNACPRGDNQVGSTKGARAVGRGDAARLGAVPARHPFEAEVIGIAGDCLRRSVGLAGPPWRGVLPAETPEPSPRTPASRIPCVEHARSVSSASL